MFPLTQGPMTDDQVLIALGVVTYLVVAPLFIGTMLLLGYLGRRAELAKRTEPPVPAPTDVRPATTRMVPEWTGAAAAV